MSAQQQGPRRLLRAASVAVALGALGFGLAAPTYADDAPATVTTGDGITYVLDSPPVAAPGAGDDAPVDGGCQSPDGVTLPVFTATTAQPLATQATWTVVGKAHHKARKLHPRASVRRARAAKRHGLR